MTEPVEDHEEDNAGEIPSSLRHRIEEAPGQGDLIRSVVETRGIRSATWQQYRDPIQGWTGDNLFGPLRGVRVNPDQPEELFTATPADIHSLLYMAANRHLRAKNKMDFFAVVESADKMAEAEGNDPTETISRHLRLWIEKMQSETGLLSVETAAARFLQASDQLLMLLNENEQVQEAAFAYADAWHWLHLELYGEHELAAKGADAERALKAGPAAKRHKGAIRSTVIAMIYEDFAQREPKEANRKSAKYVAPQIVKAVNQSLKKHDLEPLALGTIENQLRAIIRDREPKRD